jgi:formylglycine-generating enzyme required for sulfatase activity
MKKIAIVLALFALAASLAQANTPPEVTNVIATQRPHTGLIDVTFDLADGDGDDLHVTLWYSLDGVSWDHECATVSGDVGPGILPGTGLQATWDAGTDVPDYQNQQFTLRVYADDGGGGAPPAGFVLIEPGTFQMGSPEDEPGRYSNETQHPVTLTQGFYISQYEVTEEWWDDVMGSGSSTSQLPKKDVSWDMAVQFCNQLSLDEGLTPAYVIHGPDGDVTWNRDADGYRLPTEAEWEYACRAGNQAAFCNGPITHTECDPLDPNLDEVGWYCGNNSPSGPKEVGQKAPNSWGLHDMHGNLWELVWDGYRFDYEALPQEDPVHDVGPGAYRVLRGGGWGVSASFCRSARRFSHNPVDVYFTVGFRPVRSAF